MGSAEGAVSSTEGVARSAEGAVSSVEQLPGGRASNVPVTVVHQPQHLKLVSSAEGAVSSTEGVASSAEGAVSSVELLPGGSASIGHVSVVDQSQHQNLILVAVSLFILVAQIKKEGGHSYLKAYVPT
jgi:hypothetical protein